MPGTVGEAEEEEAVSLPHVSFWKCIIAPALATKKQTKTQNKTKQPLDSKIGQESEVTY